MFACPQCKVALLQQKEKDAAYTTLRCERCHGRSVKLATLAQLLNPEIANDFLVRAGESTRPSDLVCPSCMGATFEIGVLKTQTRPSLFICLTCEFSWIPPDTFRMLPFLIPKQSQ